LSKIPGWEEMQIDELYATLTKTLVEAAKRVLGTTRARYKPTMTNEIHALLMHAKQLHKEATMLPQGREKNHARQNAKEAYQTFRLEHRRHLKLNSEEFMIQ